MTQTFDDLQRDRAVNLRAWAKENPTEFYRLCARLIPTEANAPTKVEPEGPVDVVDLARRILFGLRLAVEELDQRRVDSLPLLPPVIDGEQVELSGVPESPEINLLAGAQVADTKRIEHQCTQEQKDRKNFPKARQVDPDDARVVTQPSTGYWRNPWRR